MYMFHNGENILTKECINELSDKNRYRGLVRAVTNVKYPVYTYNTEIMHGEMCK